MKITSGPRPVHDLHPFPSYYKKVGQAGNAFAKTVLHSDIKSLVLEVFPKLIFNRPSHPFNNSREADQPMDLKIADSK